MVVGRRYHFHSSGLVYVITTGVLVLGAINGQNNLLFWCFGAAVAGLVLSGIISGAALMGLRAERLPLPVGEVASPMTFQYRLTNRNRLVGIFAVVVEELESARFGRLRADWNRLMPVPRARAVYVPPGGSLTVECTATPARRGVARFGPFRAWSVFPLGLFKKSVIFHQPAAATIRPRPARVRTTLFERAARTDDAGSKPSPARVGGDEFFALRDYVQGDASRLIAWKPTARLGRMVVRELAVRPARRLWVIVAAPLEPGDAQELVIAGAAGVARSALDAGMEVGLADQAGHMLVPARSTGRHLASIQDALTYLDPASPSQTPATRVAPGDGLVFVGLSEAPLPPWCAGARRVHADDPSDVEPLARDEGFVPPRKDLLARVMATLERLFMPRTGGPP